jgi:hypothetical protein
VQTSIVPSERDAAERAARAIVADSRGSLTGRGLKRRDAPLAFRLTATGSTHDTKKNPAISGIFNSFNLVLPDCTD